MAETAGGSPDILGFMPDRNARARRQKRDPRTKRFINEHKLGLPAATVRRMSSVGNSLGSTTTPTVAANFRTLDAGNGRTVRSWASVIDANTLEQAKRAARSPVVAGGIALMPDAHVGVGSTIGSVIPTEAAIIPSAVGVDLGCGMTAVRTDLFASHLPDDLTGCLHAIERAVPAGFASHAEPTPEAESWLRVHPLPDASSTPDKLRARMGVQLGTLGGGNHFIEVSLDEGDRVWVVLHSGSRGAGNILATNHIREAKRTCAEAGRELEDKDLAYFVKDDPGFVPYVNDMLWAQEYAAANRELMMCLVLSTLSRTTGLGFDAIDHVSCHHNYAEEETHGTNTLWITRKGAIRAGSGDRGVVPGSMGDDTYIVTGKGSDASYQSAAHGSGRLMSRTKARETMTVEELERSMKDRVWLSDRAEKLLDESPASYKPIAQVMADQDDLVSVDHQLKAVLNYKGC